MNIWAAYCKPAFYNIYFDTLVAKGISRERAEKLKSHYCIYLQRIKGTRFGKELSAISNTEEFRAKLKEIFEVYWKDKVKYEEMPSHYYAYLLFLNSMQALHNDFISDEEKAKLISADPEIPIPQLTPYETNYMEGGKLVALMNPQLLYTLKEYIEKERYNDVRASLICRTFYGDLLPLMEAKDYKVLLEYLWGKNRAVKKGGKRNMIKVTYPNAEESTYKMFEGLKAIITFYGIEDVIKQKCYFREEPLIVKYVQMGKESIYERFDEKYHIRSMGNMKDILNIIRRINIHFGEKLKVELV